MLLHSLRDCREYHDLFVLVLNRDPKAAAPSMWALAAASSKRSLWRGCYYVPGRSCFAEIHEETHESLNRADNDQRDIMAAPPETPAQAYCDGARHEENDEEAEHVVPVRQGAAADCVC